MNFNVFREGLQTTLESLEPDELSKVHEDVIEATLSTKSMQRHLGLHALKGVGSETLSLLDVFIAEQSTRLEKVETQRRFLGAISHEHWRSAFLGRQILAEHFADYPLSPENPGERLTPEDFNVLIVPMKSSKSKAVFALVQTTGIGIHCGSWDYIQSERKSGKRNKFSVKLPNGSYADTFSLSTMAMVTEGSRVELANTSDYRSIDSGDGFAYGYRTSDNAWINTHMLLLGEKPEKVFAKSSPRVLAEGNIPHTSQRSFCGFIKHDNDDITTRVRPAISVAKLELVV